MFCCCLGGGEGDRIFCFSGMKSFFNFLIVQEVAFIQASTCIQCKLETPCSPVDFFETTFRLME